MKKKVQTQKVITNICMSVFIFFIACLQPMDKTFCLDMQTKSNEKSIYSQLEGTIIDELDEIDFSKFNAVINEFNKNEINLFSIENVKSKVFSILSGEEAVNYSSFSSSVFDLLIKCVARYLPILAIIIAIGVLSNLLGGIKSKFNEKSTSNLVHIVCFLSVVILVIGVISSLSANVSSSIESMVNEMNVLFPILLTLMSAIGANASVAVFQPGVAILSTYVADFFKFLILPLFMLSFVFNIITNLSDNVKLDKFNQFITSLFKWGVGICFTLFFALFSIQGISAKSFDGLGLRTTKYAIKSSVPIMGGYLSDGMDLILSSTVLIKNSVGLVGVLLIINTVISPIIEIVICSLILKLISSILQPLGNTKISNFLSSTSGSITMLSSCLIAIGFMFVLSVGLIMSTANLVV